MTSLAAVHTAAAIVVRALGDAGVSMDVRVTFDHTGIVIRPHDETDTRVWTIAVEAVAAVTDGNGSHLHCVGHIDDVPVTATWDPEPAVRRLTVVS